MKPLTDTNTILNALQKVATDHEADLVEALAIKAGFWWKCLRRLTPTSFCNWINTADDTNCGNCGIIRREK